MPLRSTTPSSTSKRFVGVEKNLRQRGDGRWYWHWDPRFVSERNEAEEQSSSIVRTELSDAATLIDIPTMLVRGRMSDIVSDESVSELKKLVPHAEVADVADAGHMVAGDRNDIFNAAVIEFVGRAMPASIGNRALNRHEHRRLHHPRLRAQSHRAQRCRR